MVTKEQSELTEYWLKRFKEETCLYHLQDITIINLCLANETRRIKNLNEKFPYPKG